MKRNDNKVLRIFAILFMGLTAAMNLLGGIGTVCAAFLTDQFPTMHVLLGYQWLYQVLMITTVAIGLAGAWATIGLVRGRPRAYTRSLAALLLGTAVGAIHVYASLALRGKARPADMKLYSNAFTLVLFLVLRLPGLRERVDFSGPEGTSTAAGLTAILIGLLSLTTPIWAAGSHTFEGNNWVHVLRTPLLMGGTVLILGGMGGVARGFFSKVGQRACPSKTLSGEPGKP